MEENRTLFRTIPFSINQAETFRSRLVGLMFRRTPLHNEGLLLAPCNSIHMCFMHFPIDVIFLSSENKIIKLVHQLKPWRFVMPVKGAHSVLELPAGTISKFKFTENEYLHF